MADPDDADTSNVQRMVPLPDDSVPTKKWIPEISFEGKGSILLAVIFGLGAGAAVVFPDAHIIGWGIMLVAALGGTGLAIHHIAVVPVGKKRSFGRGLVTFLMAAPSLAFFVFAACYLWLPQHSQTLDAGRPTDEILPGYANGAVIRIDDSTKPISRIYFAATTPQGAKVELRQAVGNQFEFTVTDAKGDQHQAEIPIGVDGIPFEKFVYLFCEVGTASAYSYIRILVNGHEVKREDFPFPLDLGNRDWAPQIGGGGSFSFSEMGVFTRTLDDAEIRKITDNSLKANGLRQ